MFSHLVTVCAGETLLVYSLQMFSTCQLARTNLKSTLSLSFPFRWAFFVSIRSNHGTVRIFKTALLGVCQMWLKYVTSTHTNKNVKNNKYPMHFDEIIRLKEIQRKQGNTHETIAYGATWIVKYNPLKIVHILGWPKKCEMLPIGALRMEMIVSLFEKFYRGNTFTTLHTHIHTEWSSAH